MAVIYLRSSSGVDTNDGLTWATAKATLASALTAAGAGGTVYVRDDHAETNGVSTYTLASPGTAAAPVRIICVSDSAEPPTSPSTGAIVSAGSLSMAFTGFGWCYGVDFRVGVGTASGRQLSFVDANPWAWAFVSCTLSNYSTSATGGRLVFGNPANTLDDQKLTLINTRLHCGNTGGLILLACRMEWWDSPGLTATSTVPGSLFAPATVPGFPGSARVVGVDLSAITGASKYLVSAGGNVSSTYNFENCRLGIDPSVAVTGTAVSPGGTLVNFFNCDDHNTNWRMVRYDWGGILSADNTVYRTGGASDGTTNFSWKMVSNASVSEAFPFYSDEIIVWNTVVGSPRAITFELTHSEASNLTDAEVWVELEVLGTSGYPVSAWKTTQRMAGLDEANPLMPATTIPSSAAGWTGAGSRKQVISATVTPQMVGPIRARIALAKPSATIWVDPNFTVS